ncbi:hypothetical protein CXB51_010137 [Gossypium anomalum]|uniref:Cytochrome P450 n=1 Tax=Gossypium anomalum TaxID=47600 RepID=A0A8J6CZ70_9ROSI|nr:hypothetical protein CXB51_010137 [Gossypium anomalum]
MEFQTSLFQLLISFLLVLFLLAASGLPHRTLRDLATKHGDFMHLQLGQVSTVVVSSPEMAKEIMKTHDIVFANRPFLVVAKMTTYECTDIVFAPYGTYWRNLRKICTSELLSAARVASFRSIREEEVLNLVETIKSNEGLAVNLTEKHRVEKIHGETDRIVGNILNDHKESRAKGRSEDEDKEDLVDLLLRVQEDGEFPLTDNNIKAILFDVFSAGSETSATAVEWAMSEMIKNPRVMTKAQAEVRQVFEGKGNVDETGVHQLKYLKCVIKETLRLHPVIPLLIPRESSKNCVVNGFEIPAKTRVIVNAWAIGRDPNYWVEPEKFEPERFVNSSVDFMGTNFEFIPFGAGRRICPGILFALPNVELPLAQLLFHFDWKLPGE